MPPGIILKYAEHMGIDADTEGKIMEHLLATFESTSDSPRPSLCLRGLRAGLCCLTRSSLDPNFLRDMIATYSTFFSSFAAWMFDDPNRTPEGVEAIEARSAECSCESATTGSMGILHNLDVEALEAPGLPPPTHATELFILLTQFVERCDEGFMKELQLCSEGKLAATPTHEAYVTLHEHLTRDTKGVVQACLSWYEKWTPLHAIKALRAICKIGPDPKECHSMVAAYPRIPPLVASSAMFYTRGCINSAASHDRDHSHYLWNQLYLFSEAMSPQDRANFLKPGAASVYKSAVELLEIMEKNRGRSEAELLRTQVFPWAIKMVEFVHPLIDNIDEVGPYDWRFSQYLYLEQKEKLTFSTPYLSLWRCVYILRATRRCFYVKCDEPTAHQTLKTCGRCQFAHYCSKDCQSAGWKDTTDVGHKLVCKDWAAISKIWPVELEGVVTTPVPNSDSNAVEASSTWKVDTKRLNAHLADIANKNGFNKRRVRNILELSIQFRSGLIMEPGVFKGPKDVGSDTESEIDVDELRNEDGTINKRKWRALLASLDIGVESDGESDEEYD